MQNFRGNIIWHICAIITITIWGTSFVSTKILLNYGFSAAQIYLMRFSMAYLVLLAISHKNFKCEHWHDEVRLAICGLTCGTIYFLAENTALLYSMASNVSLIVCTNPLLIMIFAGILYKAERLKPVQIGGSILTFIGMVLVVLNGHFVLKLSPIGDSLAFTAAVVWAIYSLVVRKINGKYSVLFISRKIFFYGVLTTTPVLLLQNNPFPVENLKLAPVWGNLLFLGIFASLFGYVVWNKVLEKLGTVNASNYIYGNPLITLIAAVIVLDEKMTPMGIIGAITIIVGMIIAEWKRKR